MFTDVMPELTPPPDDTMVHPGVPYKPYRKITDEELAQAFDNYINKYVMTYRKEDGGYGKYQSPVTGKMIVDSARKHGADPLLSVAQARVESHFGTTGRGKATTNP
jgi:hypothetical protein